MQEVIIKKVKDSYLHLKDILQTFYRYSMFRIHIEQLLMIIHKTNSSYFIQ